MKWSRLINHFKYESTIPVYIQNWYSPKRLGLSLLYTFEIRVCFFHQRKVFLSHRESFLI